MARGSYLELRGGRSPAFGPLSLCVTISIVMYYVREAQNLSDVPGRGGFCLGSPLRTHQFSCSWTQPFDAADIARYGCQSKFFMPPVVIDIRMPKIRAMWCIEPCRHWPKENSWPCRPKRSMAWPALPWTPCSGKIASDQAAIVGQGPDLGHQRPERCAGLCAEPKSFGTPAGAVLLAGTGDDRGRGLPSRESIASTPAVGSASRGAKQLDRARVPAHQMVLDILRMLVGPVVLTSATRREADPVTAEAVVEALGDRVQLVLNDGHSRLGQPSTVVKVSHNDLQILAGGRRFGTDAAETLQFMILMVCTGNTCRSPMAEVMCRKMIADKVGCHQNALGDHGVLVMSAGLSAMMGGRPTPEAVSVMAKRGLQLVDHAVAAADGSIGAPGGCDLDHDSDPSPGDRGAMARSGVADPGIESRPNGHCRSDRRSGGIR